MDSALVGYTGFVGGNLAVQYPFRALYNSKNIEDIAGRSFDLLAVSAMPAAMWMANRDPAADRAVLDRLAGCLTKATSQRVVLMSTVAVYPRPVRVDEDSPIDEATQTPYGRHRHMLERILSENFPQVVSIRLPGLFGNGLKKNAVYDLLYNNELSKVHAGASYQFYNLDRLWSDVSIALKNRLDVVNFGTEPVTVRDVARAVFGREFTNDPGTPPASFDMRTKYAALFGGRGSYLADRTQVLADLRAFVARERARGAPG